MTDLQSDVTVYSILEKLLLVRLKPRHFKKALYKCIAFTIYQRCPVHKVQTGRPDLECSRLQIVK